MKELKRLPCDEDCNSSPIGEVRNLLLVLSSGLLLAALVIAGLAYRSMRGGQYELENVLLSPDLMVVETFYDRDPANGVERAWSFDRASLSFPTSDGALHHRGVSKSEYHHLYAAIRGEHSVHADSKPYESGSMATLVLTLTPAGRYAASYRPCSFQEIQVLPSDDFRIELQEGGRERLWAYFHKRGLYAELAKLIGEPL